MAESTDQKIYRRPSTAFSIRNLLLIALALSFTGLAVKLLGHASNTPTAGPGNTYSDWYYPAGSYTSIEWTFVPLQNPPASLAQQGLAHYYAYTFGVTNWSNAVGGGYAGFLTNGSINGINLGQAINFSIWGSNGGTSPTGIINPANAESGGYQIMMAYPWVIGRHYKFQLTAGPSPTDSLGKWWGLWVTDATTSIKTFVGQERVPTTINGLPSTLLDAHTSMFGEDLHWWNSINGTVIYQCSDFQNSAMAAIGISANNGTVAPSSYTTATNSGQLNTGSSGYQTINCPVSLYSDGKMGVQHNLGYWATPAPNYLPNLEKPGDLNADGLVGIADLSILANHYGATSPTITQGDINADSKISVVDLSILASHWGL